MPEQIGYSYGAAGALDDGWTIVSLGAAEAAPRAAAMPPRSLLGTLRVRMTGLSGATAVSMALASSVDGSRKISPSNTDGATAVIDLLDGSSTEGDAVFALDDVPLVLEAADQVVALLKLDAGTATGVEARLSWRRW